MPTWEEISSKLKFGNTTIATGYYSRVNQYLKQGYGLIPISLKVPNWVNDRCCSFPELAPTSHLFFRYKSGQINQDEYIEWYYAAVLSNLNPKTLIRNMKHATKSSKIVLLCYEKPFDFCHRHIVSNWISEAGIEVCELESSIKSEVKYATV